jgi:hypothetical protein
LTATDTNGNQQSASADILPRLSTLTFATVPPGLQLTLDGQVLSAPTSVVSVVGLTRAVAAPPSQTLSGTNYPFVVWSDGGAAAHFVIVPTNAGSWTASYVPPVLALGSGAGAFTLQWPAWAAPFSLWWTTNLAPVPVWTPLAVVPATNHGMLQLTLPATNAVGFYRLQL